MPDLELKILGSNPAAIFPLADGDSLIIGREGGCDIQITETKASRRHCKVWRDGPIIRLGDLESSNGTLLEGRRIETAVTLMPGQIFSIGQTRIMLIEPGQSADDTALAAPEIEHEPEFEPTIALPDYKASAGSTATAGTQFELVALNGEHAGRITVLSEGETFVGRDQGNEIKIEGVGISARHARLVVLSAEVHIEDTSSNGTLVDGVRITRRTLTGGERISFAQQEFRLVRRGGEQLAGAERASGRIGVGPSSRRRRASSADLQSTQRAVGGMLKFVVGGVALIVLLGVLVQTITQKRKRAEEQAASVRMQGEAASKAKRAAGGSAEEQIVLGLLKRHDYIGAQGLIQAHPDKITAQVVSLYRRHQGLFAGLLDRLGTARKTKARLRLIDFTGVRVSKVTETLLALSIETATGGRRLVEYKWADLANLELLSAYRELALSRDQPLAFASFSGFIGQKKQAFSLLHKAFLSKQATGREVQAVARELGWSAAEIERLTTRESRPIPLGPVKKRPKVEPKRVERKIPKEDPAAVRRRILAEAGEILSLTRLYRYTEAEAALEELIGEVKQWKLKRQLEGELRVLRRERQVFEALLSLINKTGIPLEKTPFDLDKNLSGKLAEATEDKYTIRLDQGRVSDRWRFLGAKRLMSLFEQLPQSSNNLLGAGIFAYERGSLKAANRALIRLYRRYPSKRREIDRYLAHRLGVSPPEGGFRPYKGRLVTPEEQEMRTKGLVRYQGGWVTPEDKQRLEAGFVKYKGAWIPQGDAKLLAQGYLKYENKWYIKAELNKIRADWEKAWERETEHYRIRSNMDHDFVEQVAKTLEAAYKNYKPFFGDKEPGKKMTCWVFRTYEDWQKWCLGTNRKSLLGAAGVALSNENLFACWNKTRNNKQYFRTIVHEGAHLFFGRSYTGAITSWYAEGMATFHEAHKWIDGSDKLQTGIWNAPRYYWLKRLMNTSDWMPLRKLMAGNALSSINASRKASMAFYSEAWGLFYFLNKTTDKKLKAGFLRFRKQLDGGFLRKVRGDQKTRNTAAATLFEQEVGSIDAVEAKMKLFFAAGPK